jgi:hypothetical protein
MAAPTQLPSVLDVGFETFTAKLVVDVFDALVSTNIRQTQNYIELVNSLAKPLKDYVNDTHEATGLPEILDFLTKVAPPPPDSNDASKLAPNAPIAALSDAEKQVLTDALKLSASDGGKTGPGFTDNIPVLADPQVVGGKLTDEGWNAILEAVARRIAADKYSLLQEMVKQGALRLVVEDGVIETKLHFTTSVSDYWSRVRTDYTKKTRDWGVHGRSGFGLLRWLSISGGIHQNSVTVNTGRTRTTEQSGTSVDLRGLVRIRFKTDYQPLSK